jgi:hypothetical protein
MLEGCRTPEDLPLGLQASSLDVAVFSNVVNHMTQDPDHVPLFISSRIVSTLLFYDRISNIAI